MSCISLRRSREVKRTNNQRAFLLLFPVFVCVFVRQWLGCSLAYLDSSSPFDRPLHLSVVFQPWLSSGCQLSLAYHFIRFWFLFSFFVITERTSVLVRVCAESVFAVCSFLFKLKLLLSSNRRFRAGWRILLVCLPHSQPQQQQPLGRSSVPVKK